MKLSEDQLKITQYLSAPHKYPRPDTDQDLHFLYLLTYIGELFVQGYRIIKHSTDVIIFQLAIYQDKLPRIKVMMWQISNKKMFQSAKERRQIFDRLQMMGKQYEDAEYHIVYLHNFHYTILKQIEKQKFPTSQCYYKEIEYIQQPNKLYFMNQKNQGITLHKLIQIFLKKERSAENLKEIYQKRNQRLSYDVFKVISSVCYIIGKQFLQNEYQTMEVEKSIKCGCCHSVKRFDLLLRNKEKSCVIDWKFSKLKAKQKIESLDFTEKNNIYFQLANSEFKTKVEVKFYCFHKKEINNYYHSVTCAIYLPKMDQVQKEEPSINQVAIDPISAVNISNRDVIVLSDDDQRLIPEILEEIVQHQEDSSISRFLINIDAQIEQNLCDKYHDKRNDNDEEQSINNQSSKTKKIRKQRLRKHPKKFIDDIAISIDSD